MAEMKHRIVHALQKYVLNPPIKLLFAVGVAPPGYALLETIGKQTPAAEPLPALVTSRLGHDSEVCTTATTARLERGGAEGTSSSSLREVCRFRQSHACSRPFNLRNAKPICPQAGKLQQPCPFQVVLNYGEPQVVITVMIIIMTRGRRDFSMKADGCGSDRADARGPRKMKRTGAKSHRSANGTDVNVSAGIETTSGCYLPTAGRRTLMWRSHRRSPVGRRPGL